MKVLAELNEFSRTRYSLEKRNLDEKYSHLKFGYVIHRKPEMRKFYLYSYLTLNKKVINIFFAYGRIGEVISNHNTSPHSSHTLVIMVIRSK